METIEAVLRLLEEAEKGLAALASEVTKRGDYETAGFVIDLARTLSGLASRARDKRNVSETEGPELRTEAQKYQSGQPAGTRLRPKKAEYPRFIRDNDNLVKVGWSRSEKTEYEHRSPKKTIAIVATALAKAGANGRRFTVDQILPLLDPDDGNRVPDYRVYLCLAWLRSLRLVVQHGRQGYSLASKAPIDALFETHWESLPKR